MTGSDGTGTDGDRDEYGRDEAPSNDPPAHDDGGEDAMGPETDGGIDWREGPDLPPPAPAAGFGAARDVDEPEQLPLGDDDVRLPWLEAGEDDAEEGGSGGQLAGLLVLGLLALGLIVGAIWWATRRHADDTLVADGGVINAPAQPYKEKPRDPGGKTFDGTGDTSFAVSEGQTRTTKLDQADAATRPGFASVPDPAAKPAAGAGAPATATGGAASAAPAAAAGGVGVQVGAFSTKATAEAGWGKLAQQYSALSGHAHRVVEGKADIGTVYRLQAVAADAGAARSLCGQLRSAGLACQVKE